MNILTYWLKLFADYIVLELIGLDEGLRFTEALLYFIPAFTMIMVLLIIVVYTMSLLTSYLSFNKIRTYLERHNQTGAGNVLAAMFGAITPFCSCSSIPVFIGMMQAKLPLGIALSFLITSPLVNEIAIAVFWVTYGWQVTVIYVVSGIVLGVAGGILLEKMGLSTYVADWIQNLEYQNSDTKTNKRSLKLRLPEIHKEAYSTIKNLVPYLFTGLIAGSFIHGFVPETFFRETVAADNVFSVPIAVIMAIPLYIDAVTILPVIDTLVDKGVPLGTSIAFMMGSIGLSLPSAILLKKVMKMKLIVSFFVTIGIGMIILGYFFNFIL